MKKYDFNMLEEKAKNLLDLKLPREAIKIYLYMADGDQSLDGGYLAKKIAQYRDKFQPLACLHTINTNLWIFFYSPSIPIFGSMQVIHCFGTTRISSSSLSPMQKKIGNGTFFTY